MTDREKLLKLYNDLKSIEVPIFETEAINVIANTVFEGIKIILSWLAATAREHFGNNNR